MNTRELFKLFTDIFGRTPFHPQFFSKYFLNRQIKLKANQFDGLIVDLGCGFGPYKKYFNKAKYLALDYPTTTPSGGVEAIDAFMNLNCLALTSSCLDGALCTQVLEHISEPTQAVSEIARVLKPGGKLLLSVPFFYPLHDEPYDFFRYSPHGVKHLLSKAGLKVIEIKSQGGFIAMSGEFANLFFIHKTQNLLFAGRYLRLLGFGIIPIVLIFAFLVNIICIILSPLDKERRFVMNYFIFAERE